MTLNLTFPTPVHFFFSVLYQSQLVEEKDVLTLFQNKWGETDLFIPDASTMVAYYAREMGEAKTLKRLLLFFPVLRSREELALKKWWAMAEEEKGRGLDGGRKINIDPGYLSLEQMVLATHKPYAHRLSLSGGLYAELTYIYQAQSFGTLPWTYPDYGQKNLIEAFELRRKVLKNQIDKKRISLSP